MANIEQNEEQQDQLENVENSLGKTELFIEENKDKFLYGLIAVLVIVLGVWGYLRHKNSKNLEASAQMSQAEVYLEMDSVALALNGDANYPGFLQIISDYSGTKAANIAKLKAGICYMKQGAYDEAIKMLDGFSSSDPFFGPQATALIGDAYMEKGNTDKAESNYKKAAKEAAGNDFLAPIFLNKLAVALEKEQKFADALDVYTQIKKDYPTSTEGRSADKNIKAMQIKLGK